MNKIIKLRNSIGVLMLLLGVFTSQAQSVPQDSEQARVANALLGVVNTSTARTYKWPVAYEYYYRSLMRNVGSKTTKLPQYRVVLRYFKPSDDAYKQAVERAKVMEGFTESDFFKAVNDTWQTHQTIVSLNYEATDLVQSAVADSASYAKAFQLLSQLADQTELLRARATSLDSISALTQLSRSQKGMNNWLVAGGQMRQSLTLAREVLHGAKDYYLGVESILPDTTELSVLLTHMQQNRDRNMGTIKELGRYNGLDPHAKYDDLISKLRSMMIKLPPKYIPGRDGPSFYFREILSDFNSAVHQYNLFADLSFENGLGESSAFLLYAVKEPGLYQYVLPPHEEAPHTATTAQSPVSTPDPELGSMEGYAYNRLVILMDVSGSMNHPTKLPLLKQALQRVAAIMRPEDKLSVVIFSDDARVVVEEVSFSDATALQQIQRLESKGKTNTEKGIRAAYKLSEKYRLDDGNNRIILATDGDFILTKPILQLIKEQRKEGVHLSVFAFGSTLQQVDQMKKMSKTGGGNYVMIKKGNSVSALLSELQSVTTE